MTDDQQPISGLDDALDLLVEVLTRTPDLSGLIEGLRAYELALALVPIGAPAAVDAVSVAATWSALAAWNNQSEAVKNNEAKFKAARSAFIETATAMGVPEAAAKRLARQLLEIPQSRVIGVTLNDQDALGQIARFKAQFAGIKDKSVTLTTYLVTQNVGQHKRGQVADAQQADGGTVEGPRHPYGDKVLTMLAPGEEVITNRHGEADRFRADRAAGRIPAYADGGTVGRGGAAGIDYQRLGASVAAALTSDRSLAFRDARDAHLAALRAARMETPAPRTPTDPLLMYGVI